MKRKYLLYTFLITIHSLFAQTNYRDLLVRDQRTYWATAESLFKPFRYYLEVGIWFDKNGEFDWYEITDENDTLSLYDGIDTEIFVSHRTYELHQDTIFVMTWPSYLSSAIGPSEEDDAYKILYIAEQKMLLLPLTKNKNGNWEENTYPPYHRSYVSEYRYMGKP